MQTKKKQGLHSHKPRDLRYVAERKEYFREQLTAGKSVQDAIKNVREKFGVGLDQGTAYRIKKLLKETAGMPIKPVVSTEPQAEEVALSEQYLITWTAKNPTSEGSYMHCREAIGTRQLQDEAIELFDKGVDPSSIAIWNRSKKQVLVIG